MEIKRCGTCHYGKVIVQDISKRLCHGAPPSCSQMPGPRGQMTMQMARPIVSVTDEACALHRDKNAQDVVREGEAIQVMQRIATSETKQ